MLSSRKLQSMSLNKKFSLLHDPPAEVRRKTWVDRIPVFGQVDAYARQVTREQALVNQAIDRGPVPESVWAPYTYSASIRRKIEAIVIDEAYPKGSTFHPLDPVEYMFVLRFGDLNEVEILMEVERQLGFKVNDSLVAHLINEHTTFIDFIRMVENASVR